MLQMDIPATNGVIQVVENVIEIDDGKDTSEEDLKAEIEAKFRTPKEPRIFKFR